MGSVEQWPVAGRVYVDAPILIYSVERHPDYLHVLRQFWLSVATTAVQAVTSELSLLETTVLPRRTGDSALVAAYEAMLARPELEVRPIDSDVLREAARLRAAEPALRTPDAIHGATARLGGCSTLFTNDVALRRLPGMNVVLAKDVAGMDGESRHAT